MNKKKIIIVLIAIIALLLLTNGVLYILNINKKAVLGYHAFTSEETSDNNFEMTAKNFEKQMKWMMDIKVIMRLLFLY